MRRRLATKVPSKVNGKSIKIVQVTYRVFKIIFLKTLMLTNLFESGRCYNRCSQNLILTSHYAKYQARFEASALRRTFYRFFLLTNGRFEFTRVPYLCLREMSYLVFCRRSEHLVFSLGLQTQALCCGHLGYLLMWSSGDSVTYIIFDTFA